MKKQTFFLSSMIFLIALGTTPSLAETRYVKDELVITVRSGESSQHQILRTAKSGTKMEVLETHPDSGYALVELSDGTEGWVLTQYLTNRPIAKHSLKAAREELENARQRYNALQKKLDHNQKELEESEQRNRELLEQTQALDKEISHIRNIAGHAPALSDQNQTLKADVIRLETMVQTLEQENLLIKDRSARDWFIAGTGVTLLGIAIGFVGYKIRGQKRSSWSEL